MKLQRFLKKGLWALVIITPILFITSCSPNIDELRRNNDVPKLIKALEHRDYHIRRDAAFALGEIGDPSAVEPLAAALKDDENWVVRDAAAGALGEIGDTQAVQTLLNALADEHKKYVIEEITESLIELGIGEEDTELLTDAIMQLDDEDFDFVLTLVLDDMNDHKTITPWISALGESGDAQFVEFLLTLLAHKKPRVRQSAADALAQIGEPAIEPLLVALDDDDILVQSTAAQALGEIGDPQAVDDLLTLALRGSPTGYMDDYVLRMDAAQALGAIGKPGIEPLIAALSNSNQKIRENAEEALEFIGESAVEMAVEPLIDATKTRIEGDACAYDLEEYVNLLIDLGQHISNSGKIYAIENALIHALNDCGTQSLANKYLKSGNKRLGSAARDWAEENGYTVISVPSGGSDKSWGSP